MTINVREHEFVAISHKNGIATVTLNRPDVRNAVNDQMRAELIELFEQLATDKSVRAVILTGAGKGFCSGGDVSGMRARLDAAPGDVAFNGWTRQRSTHKGVAVIHGITKPVIAAVNGAAFGLGLDMALACDFIIASEGAKMSMSFIKRGLVSDGGGMYFLPRRVGLSRAKELILTARVVETAEALQIGMIDRVASPESLLEEAQVWAEQLTIGSPAAVALTKSILNKTFESSDETIFALGREAQAICYTTAEHRASVEAFLNKSSE
ncbi:MULTISPECIES: enoyl-CoA hydratase/isomerase family protein [Agrobacterium]|uniref:enoyl-CoA hydratase/isomerase family protein n=1 Tax=Agrobacterium TaxID=357 RepID=UPI0011EF02AB|nr:MULTISPECIES: enoyl-CoA hydratase/isomerase family protein [Agrobacterium]MDA5639383.1 enoyl-CoA hydratase/isomerase family protein [Agrobacterium sp. ST15.13.013]MDA6999344.1 enoyl-CoA hydratase/isomerase family protein [Agrobacterium salinitolerans]QXC49349.1 enoyl-CoA hydratase/isomerase family protein [Agrobacterium salinitolerans]QXC53188.1 enoyl-CoA hydratase/isomerase family protein [Agrobacterium salinitolerans]TZG33407.1 enoyl-CoA hydratase/isomerase family protein [Agrobacterium s